MRARDWTRECTGGFAQSQDDSSLLFPSLSPVRVGDATVVLRLDVWRRSETQVSTRQSVSGDRDEAVDVAGCHWRTGRKTAAPGSEQPFSLAGAPAVKLRHELEHCVYVLIVRE